MEPILTTDQILAILRGCEETLRLVQATESYRQIQASEYFSTTNDVYLGDAINTLIEVGEAVFTVQTTERQ